MKPTHPPQILSDQLWQLHGMETQIARELPVLAGSVLNAPLRRWLSRRAMAARQRRDHLEDLLKHHAHPLATRPHCSIRAILVEGNRELSRIHHPYARDAAMIEHCIRIEQHATTSYGIAVPMTHRFGFPAISGELKQLLEDLEKARSTFHSLEETVFAIDASHPHFGASDPSHPAKRHQSKKPAAMPAMAVGY